MLSYIARRLLQSLFVLFIIIFITFSLPYVEPRGIYAPAYLALGPHATPANIHLWAVAHGVDKPFFFRFWLYISNVFFHFNLGYSYQASQPVWSILSLYVPRTIWLALTSLILTSVIAIPLGIFQASRRNTAFDYSATGIAFVLYAMPSFLLCSLVLEFFGFHWPHLPVSPPSGVAPWLIFTDPGAFIMPIGCLTLLSVAGLSRFMRGTVLEVLVQDYIRTARAKGGSSRHVLFKHAFRNALGPIVTILGLSVPGLLGGAIVIESVFNYGGLGYETVNAALSGDVNVVLGITLLVSILTLLGNLLADVGLGLVNPRIRIEGSTR